MSGEVAHWKALLEKRCPELRLKPGVPAAQLTTFALGGTVSLLAEPLSPAGASQLLAVLAECVIPWRVIGSGSNIVISDEGISEVVLRLGKEFSGCVFGAGEVSTEQELTQQWELSGGGAGFSLPPEGGLGESVSMLAFGGAPLMGLSRKLSNAGFSGLEFAAGIPGSAGGAVRMNAGAHGHAFQEIVRGALISTAGGGCKRISAAELGFGYRKSSLASDSLVIAVELVLRRKNLDEILEHRAKCLEYRKRTQPLNLPSAGSTFKNPSPPDESGARMTAEAQPAAALLLEQAGLKGFCHGGVGFSELHSNWLVKKENGAKASDVHYLINAAQERVRERFSIHLTPEIILW